VTITRRDVLRLAAAAAAAPLVPGAVSAEATGTTPTASAAGRFFSAPELRLLDELTELILPADEHSGGAREAKVAAYIDGRLAEYDPEIPDLREARELWKAGLATVDTACREAVGKPFLEASHEERTAVLERLAAKEQQPQSDGERFFVELKRWTARGYYTSRVGIHDELEYKGNTLQTEYAGVDPATLPPVRPPRD
jgi:hypothetical protein